MTIGNTNLDPRKDALTMEPTSGSLNSMEVPPPNHPGYSYWLFGARIWAEYNLKGRSLWEFRGQDGQTGTFNFINCTQRNQMKIFTIESLTAFVNFRPFCLDTSVSDENWVYFQPRIKPIVRYK